MSNANKGEKNPNFGKHFSAETRQKISDAKKGNQNTLGHHFSEETKQKMSDAHKGRLVSEDTRKKMSAAHKGKLKGRHWHLENCRRIYTD